MPLLPLHCHRCRMGFRVGEPCQGERHICPEPGCGKPFWSAYSLVIEGNVRTDRAVVGVTPDDARRYWGLDPEDIMEA